MPKPRRHKRHKLLTQSSPFELNVSRCFEQPLGLAKVSKWNTGSSLSPTPPSQLQSSTPIPFGCFSCFASPWKRNTKAHVAHRVPVTTEDQDSQCSTVQPWSCLLPVGGANAPPWLSPQVPRAHAPCVLHQKAAKRAMRYPAIPNKQRRLRALWNAVWGPFSDL